MRTSKSNGMSRQDSHQPSSTQISPTNKNPFWPLAKGWQHPSRFRIASRVAWLTLALAVVMSMTTTSETNRLVVVKADGLPFDLVDLLVRRRDPRTGKSSLPWIEAVFYKSGTRLENFYVRGLSLSASSWSILDTGQHQVIKSNVEYDRLTLNTYDYLNFFSFYLGFALKKRVDMPGVELLDEVRVPLLADAYSDEERQVSFQLYQRAARLGSLGSTFRKGFLTRNPRELLDEWTAGLDTGELMLQQMERELFRKLKDPSVRYLDYYTTSFDHVAHLNRDLKTQLAALQNLDALIGRVWNAIRNAPLSEQTALALVSDHGMNTDERVYSQGYNLVRWLGETAGGAHHVFAHRPLLASYSLKSLDPRVPPATVNSESSYYLKGEGSDYPTALFDSDGNERASIHLRDSDLNSLHILLQQLSGKPRSSEVERALVEALFQILDRRRPEWMQELTEIQEELEAIKTWIRKERTRLKAKDQTAGTSNGREEDLEILRQKAYLERLEADWQAYSEFARTRAKLLALAPANFNLRNLQIAALIPKKSLGGPNSVYQLQNYVAGPGPDGMQLQPDGSLNWESSFVRLNYFESLQALQVRNNVQKEVDSRPVDFTAVRIPREALVQALDPDLLPEQNPVWLYAGEDRQALVLFRHDARGGLVLRYTPVAHLRQDEAGRIAFQRCDAQPDLPLRLWEDPQLLLPQGHSRAWLEEWHTEQEWFQAIHRTRYTNALISLHEHFHSHAEEILRPEEPGLSAEERLLRRFRLRQRRMVEPDLLVLARNYWNFNVRGFNPGGNHGSFFPLSTRATLMFSGGNETGIPRGLLIDQPYDTLSFVPTLLALTGQLRGQNPRPSLSERGFRRFPGPVIEELFP